VVSGDHAHCWTSDIAKKMARTISESVANAGHWTDNKEDGYNPWYNPYGLASAFLIEICT